MAMRANGATATAPASSQPRFDARALIENGVLAGLIGALAVALWFLVLDSLQGRPFYTPSLLGSVIFQGTSVEQVTSVGAIAVFAYTGLHGVLFLLVGTLFSWIVSQIGRQPQIGMLLLLLLVIFEGILMGLEVTIVPRLVGALGAAAVGIANLLSATAMIWFLLRRNPRALERLQADWRGQ